MGYIRPSPGALDVKLQIWFSAPRFSLGGGLESLCVGRVYGADGASSLHSELFHKEDARSNNPPIYIYIYIHTHTHTHIHIHTYKRAHTHTHTHTHTMHTNLTVTCSFAI